MKYGIYYAYWETEWGGDFLPYIKKVKDLGFDILEVACGDFAALPMDYFKQLKKEADQHGIMLTGGYGPRPEHNIASQDPKVAEQAFAFYENIFPKMQAAGIDSIGGALYSYWPVDYSQEITKEKDYGYSIEGMKRLADLAAQYGISLYMEVLNRFEGYLLNEAKEACDYVDAVDRDNVKVMLDTFHMNIEEDDFIDAIYLTGSRLGELHVGEANRKPPRPGRMPWAEIGSALRAVGFNGKVVMEPFVRMGGQVGRDIKMWRDLSGNAGIPGLDAAAAESVAFLRSAFEAKERIRKKDKIVAMGELLIDLTPSGFSDRELPVYEQNPGGAPANVAVAAARQGSRTAVISAVGKDPFGKFLKAVMVREGVDITHLEEKEEACTTAAVVSLSKRGEREFHFIRKPGADMLLDAKDVPGDFLTDCSILHFGSLSLSAPKSEAAIKQVIKKAKQNGALLAFDVNWREDIWDSRQHGLAVIGKYLERVDLLKLSEEELALLTGESEMRTGINKIRERYPSLKLLAVTLGEKGCCYAFQGVVRTIPGYLAEAVDTTGAGDAFWGNLLHNINRTGWENLSLEKLEDALDKANFAGAFCIEHRGAIYGLPGREEMKKRSNRARSGG